MNARELLERAQLLRDWLRQVDAALGQLSPAERLILQKLILEREQGNPALLCQLLEMEPATLYRKRTQLLKKLQKLPKIPE